MVSKLTSGIIFPHGVLISLIIKIKNWNQIYLNRYTKFILGLFQELKRHQYLMNKFFKLNIYLNYDGWFNWKI